MTIEWQIIFATLSLLFDCIGVNSCPCIVFWFCGSGGGCSALEFNYSFTVNLIYSFSMFWWFCFDSAVIFFQFYRLACHRWTPYRFVRASITANIINNKQPKIIQQWLSREIIKMVATNNTYKWSFRLSFFGSILSRCWRWAFVRCVRVHHHYHQMRNAKRNPHSPSKLL